MKKYLYIAGGCLILILVAFFIGRCGRNDLEKRMTDNLKAARDSIHTSQVEINGLKNYISEKDALLLTKEEAINSGVIENERLKKLHIKDLITNAELNGIIHRQDSMLDLPPKQVFITIKDTSGVTNNYLRIPFILLDIKDKYLTLLAGMDINKKAYYDFETPLSGIMSIGYVRSGFLKTKPAGVFTTENPNIKVNNMNITIIQEPKKWYQKWWVHELIGGGIVEGLNIYLNRR